MRGNTLKEYLLRHTQVLLACLGQLARVPGSTLLTVSAIGITLALPTILYLLVENVRILTGDWHGKAQASLFLKHKVSSVTAESLAHSLQRRPEISSIQLISAERALEEFKADSGYGRALDVLGENPLPSSIIIEFAAGIDLPAIQSMVSEFETLPEVDMAQWDMAWIERLQVILKLIQRAVWVLATLLGIAVVIIISNTIRLAIIDRREEIELMKLIGATDGFIRRPFLYVGVIQGFFGALLATIVSAGCLNLVQGPLLDLLSLYQGGFSTSGISVTTFILLLATGCSLGWLAAHAAVGRYLRQIEPE